MFATVWSFCIMLTSSLQTQKQPLSPKAAMVPLVRSAGEKLTVPSVVDLLILNEYPPEN